LPNVAQRWQVTPAILLGVRCAVVLRTSDDTTATRTPAASAGTFRCAFTRPAGVFVRVAQRLLALTAAIWHNDRTGQLVKRSLLAYDH